MRLVAWNALLTVIVGLIALAGAEAYLRSTIGPMREGQLFEYRADSKRLKVMKPGMLMNIYGVEVQTTARRRPFVIAASTLRRCATSSEP